MILSNADAMPLHELLAQGGWAMYPIYACSVLTVGMFLKKVFELRAARLQDVSWVESVVEHALRGELDAAHRACRAVVHPASRVVAALVHALDEAPEQAEAEAKRVATLELTRLESGVNLLSFLAQVSPLLGLLGTVLGMIAAFNEMAATGGAVDPTELAGGIWIALSATAIGLGVAIPFYFFTSWIEGRIERERAAMDTAIVTIVYGPGVDLANQARTGLVAHPPAQPQAMMIGL